MSLCRVLLCEGRRTVRSSSAQSLACAVQLASRREAGLAPRRAGLGLREPLSAAATRRSSRFPWVPPMAAAAAAAAPAPAGGKAERGPEIYTHESAWPIYAAAWSVRGSAGCCAPQPLLEGDPAALSLGAGSSAGLACARLRSTQRVAGDGTRHSWVRARLSSKLMHLHLGSFPRRSARTAASASPSAPSSRNITIEWIL